VPLWKNVGRLWSALAAQGITDPGDVDLVGPVQTVQLVDDASHAAQPVSVPISGAHITSPAVAARRSSIAIQPGPRGTLFVGASVGASAATNHLIWSETSLALLANATLVARGLGLPNQLPQLSRFWIGDVLPASIPATAPIFRPAHTSSAGIVPMDLYIAPGSVLFIADDADNTAQILSLWVQDVP
jgi:hypothetical protein